MKKSSLLLSILMAIVVFSVALYLYKTEPDGLLGFYYERAYADRLWAEPEVLLNQTPAFFDLPEGEWSFQKKNGQWYTTPSLPDSTGDKAQNPVSVTSVEDQWTLTFDKEPDWTNLKLIDAESGKTIYDEDVELPNLPLPQRNGTFFYEVSMKWTAESSPYRGEYVLEIPLEVQIPETFVFSEEQVTQGQLLEITVYYADAPGDIFFEQSIDSKFKWYQQEDVLRGYLPTNYSVKPGIHQIHYGVKSKGIRYTREIEVVPYPYQTQYLYVDPQVEGETRNREAYDEFYTYFTPVRQQSEPTRYYVEEFDLPVGGRLTTEFGETRYVNDSPTSYRHSGVDIAAPAGTEVKAVNRGKVVFARPLILTGNTVAIDHGEGLFSVYYHMKSLSVKSGEMAERGQVIGEVGSTGFSTGPHLHFMMSYYTTNLEPGYFLVGEPITYDNYREWFQ